MNEEPKKDSLADILLEQIKRGALRMKPRSHFILKAVLHVTGAAVALLFVLYIVSLIHFGLRESGAWFAPLFGWRGIGIFIYSLPWLLLLFAAAFVAALEAFVKKYPFAYRKPLLYSVCVIALVTLAGSVLFSRVHFHERIWRAARTRHIPFAERIYGGIAEPRLRAVHPLVIRRFSEDGFFARNRRGEELRVIITPSTRFPSGIDFAPGDEAVVFGLRATDTDTMEAFGIKRMAPPKRGKDFPQRRTLFRFAPELVQ